MNEWVSGEYFTAGDDDYSWAVNAIKLRGGVLIKLADTKNRWVDGYINEASIVSIIIICSQWIREGIFEEEDVDNTKLISTKCGSQHFTILVFLISLKFK